MFWPDEKDLIQDWSGTAAWSGGPTYATLVAALMPVIRVATLHGYRISSINIGFGEGIAAEGQWQRIDLATAQMAPGEWPSPELPMDGPGIWFDLEEITDLLGEQAGTYCTNIDIPIFAGGYTNDGTVPGELLDDIDTFVELAIGDLEARVSRDRPMARLDGDGLLWIFDANWWYPNSAAVVSAVNDAMLTEFLLDPGGFLRGQVYADRKRHKTSEASGPANLSFLLAFQSNARQLHTDFWNSVLWELQTRGQATRIFEPERRLFRHRDKAPTWLDVLASLLRRGVILIDGLLEPGDEPPDAIAVSVEAEAGGVPSKLKLWVWGDTAITLRRDQDFPDQAAPGVGSSVAWDYVRGDSQVKPTVLIVAGRGVAIEHRIDTGRYRPWDLQIFRVQDDAFLPGPGEYIDTEKLLTATQVEPYDEECTGPVTDEYVAAYWQVAAKPKPDGVYLVYPTSPETMPTDMSGSVSGWAPAVVELCVDPLSGKQAWTADVHYFTDRFFDPAIDVFGFNGGAHVTVWVSEGVTVKSNLSDNTEGAAAGNPTVLMKWISGKVVLFEIWVTDRPELMPRPWKADLPVLPWVTAAPEGTFWAGLSILFEEYAPGAIQDLFPGDRDHPFPDPAPSEVDYDADLQRADWFDERGSQQFIGLTPAAHAYQQYLYTDTILFDAMDFLIGFMPVIGDLADVGETVYAWQTGRDKWGRPVSDLQLAAMIVFCAVPFVSAPFAHTVLEGIKASPIGELLRAATPEELGRLMAKLGWSNDIPLPQVQAAMAEPSLLRGSAEAAQSSASRRQLSQELAAQLGQELGPVAGLAEGLFAGNVHGWLTRADLLARRGALGLADAPMQTAYLRQLRRDPLMTPVRFVEAINGA